MKPSGIMEQTVGGLVAEHPDTREVFERFGIDYCCGGARQVRVAADEEGVDRGELQTAVEAALGDEGGAGRLHERAWAGEPLTDLADHIVSRHHAFMREQLPRIDGLLEKVAAAHAERHGAMLERLAGTFAGLRQEIEMHLLKEEQVLFPYIRAMDAYEPGSGDAPSIHCITVRNPVAQMEREHEDAGHALERMREITGDYALPSDACEAFRALYDGLQALEADLHQHIHLENNILFPGAVRREEEIGCADSGACCPD
jgi:regulator of cell morphogenesis and NO signaling